MAKQASKKKDLKGLTAKTLSSILMHHPASHGHCEVAEHDDHRTSDHMLSSVRRAHHSGHDIEITTTYEIKIDGRKVNVHARVEEDGSLRCHSLPYTSHVSAVDLVKALIDSYPKAAEAVANPRRRHALKLEPTHEPKAPRGGKSKKGGKK